MITTDVAVLLGAIWHIGVSGPPRLPMGEWPGSRRYPSAVKSVVAVRLVSLASGRCRKWS